MSKKDLEPDENGVIKLTTMNLDALQHTVQEALDIQKKAEEEAGPVRALPEGVKLLSFGGYCPVQADGEVDGKLFYFRARGNSWSMHIYPKGTKDIFFDDNPEVWSYSEDYGFTEFAAGWMTKKVAFDCMTHAIELYRKQQNEKTVSQGVPKG